MKAKITEELHKTYKLLTDDNRIFGIDVDSIKTLNAAIGVADFAEKILDDNDLNKQLCKKIKAVAQQELDTNNKILAVHKQEEYKVYRECLETLNPIASIHISSLLNLGITGQQVDQLLEKLGYIYMDSGWQPTDKGLPFVVKIYDENPSRRYLMWNRTILQAIKNDLTTIVKVNNNITA